MPSWFVEALFCLPAIDFDQPISIFKRVVRGHDQIRRHSRQNVTSRWRWSKLCEDCVAREIIYESCVAIECERSNCGSNPVKMHPPGRKASNTKFEGHMNLDLSQIRCVLIIVQITIRLLAVIVIVGPHHGNCPAIQTTVR